MKPQNLRTVLTEGADPSRCKERESLHFPHAAALSWMAPYLLFRVLNVEFFSHSFPDLVAPCFGIHPLQGGGGPGQRSAQPRVMILLLRISLLILREWGEKLDPFCPAVVLGEANRDSEGFWGLWRRWRCIYVFYEIVIESTKKFTQLKLDTSCFY